MEHIHFRHGYLASFRTRRIKDDDVAMRKSRVIRIIKYGAMDHHREILEDAGERGVDLVSRSREREGKVRRVGRGYRTVR